MPLSEKTRKIFWQSVHDKSHEKKRLRLADSKTVGDGIAILIYELADVEAKGADSD